MWSRTKKMVLMAQQKTVVDPGLNEQQMPIYTEDDIQMGTLESISSLSYLPARETHEEFVSKENNTDGCFLKVSDCHRFCIQPNQENEYTNDVDHSLNDTDILEDAGLFNNNDLLINCVSSNANHSVELSMAEQSVASNGKFDLE